MDCQLCGKSFTKNQQKGGAFYRHLKNEHNITLEDYVVITEYNNNPPKCACGLCDERPTFKRGQFLNYAPGHKSFKWREWKYKENYGHPICKHPDCNNNVNFNRGQPNNYCSDKCCGLYDGGFTKKEVQDKIKKSVWKNYGVSNIIYLDEVKERQKKSLKQAWRDSKEEIMNKTKNTKKEKHGDENYVNKEKIRQTLNEKYGVNHISQTNFMRKQSSQKMINDNPFHKINVKTERYKYTNLNYQSSYEYNFLEFCEENGVLDRIKNAFRFEYLEEDKKFGYFYLPDYIYDDQFIIEIKSEWIKNIQGGDIVLDAKKRSVENNGYNFILIMDNNFEEFKYLLND